MRHTYTYSVLARLDGAVVSEHEVNARRPQAAAREVFEGPDLVDPRAILRVQREGTWGSSRFYQYLRPLQGLGHSEGQVQTSTAMAFYAAWSRV